MFSRVGYLRKPVLKMTNEIKPHKNMFTNTIQCFASQWDSEEHLGISLSECFSISVTENKNASFIISSIKLWSSHSHQTNGTAHNLHIVYSNTFFIGFINNLF